MVSSPCFPFFNNPLTDAVNRYICTTYAGYLYQTLAWTLGNAPPENPTCQKVDVQRLFVGQKAY